MIFPFSNVDLPPGSVAVVTNFYVGFLGGPLSRLLKCLTAVKLCAEFKNNGIAAVPVCLVCRGDLSEFSPLEISFIDRRSKLHCFKSSGKEAGIAESPVCGSGTEKLFGEIEKIFPDGDSEALSAFKEAFAYDTNSVSSCARWIRYLMKDFSVIVVEYSAFMPDQNSGDPESVSALNMFLRQGGLLTVAAFVADSAEIGLYAKALPILERDGFPRPLVWPCLAATISRARYLKTLDRYGLDFARLFDGRERVMNYVRETLKSDVPARLRELRDETRAVLDELQDASIAFAARGVRSDRIRETRAARIIHQLEKIQRLSVDALANKEKTAENRIRKACDFLAPLGRRQQDALGGAQIPFSYGRSGLRTLYENLDVTAHDHQLIEMN